MKMVLEVYTKSPEKLASLLQMVESTQRGVFMGQVRRLQRFSYPFSFRAKCADQFQPMGLKGWPIQSPLIKEKKRKKIYMCPYSN